MDDRRVTALAAELGLSEQELREAQTTITQGLDTALLGGLIRFEDALIELSR